MADTGILAGIEQHPSTSALVSELVEWWIQDSIKIGWFGKESLLIFFSVTFWIVTVHVAECISRWKVEENAGRFNGSRKRLNKLIEWVALVEGRWACMRYYITPLV